MTPRLPDSNTMGIPHDPSLALPTDARESSGLSEAGVLRSVHGLLDRLELAGDDVSMSVDLVGRLVRDAERAVRRLTALKLALVAKAEKANVASRTGMTSTGAWLAATTQDTGDAAARQTQLAAALEDGQLPKTRAALTAGEVSAENAAIIAHASAQLPDDLTAAERQQVEQRLVSDAKVLNPKRLRRAARSVLRATQRPQAEIAAHHDGVLRSEEDTALAAARLSWHENNNGTITGSFTVPTLAGSILIKTIQQLVSPARNPNTGEPLTAPSTWAADPRADALDWAHRRGVAFTELLERLPVDHLSGKVNATIVVTIDHAQLTDMINQHPHAGHIDTGDEISAAEARRLACGAGIVPAILDGQTLPLDLGRQSRYFSEHQRLALGVRYTECAADGCDRPFAWNQLHHQDLWSLKGESNLNRAVPLCGYHHRRVHDPTYHHTITTNRHGIKTVHLRLRT